MLPTEGNWVEKRIITDLDVLNEVAFRFCIVIQFPCSLCYVFFCIIFCKLVFCKFVISFVSSFSNSVSSSANLFTSLLFFGACVVALLHFLSYRLLKIRILQIRNSFIPFSENSVSSSANSYTSLSLGVRCRSATCSFVSSYAYSYSAISQFLRIDFFKFVYFFVFGIFGHLHCCSAPPSLVMSFANSCSANSQFVCTVFCKLCRPLALRILLCLRSLALFCEATRRFEGFALQFVYIVALLLVVCIALFAISNFCGYISVVCMALLHFGRSLVDCIALFRDFEFLLQSITVAALFAGVAIGGGHTHEAPISRQRP